MKNFKIGYFIGSLLFLFSCSSETGELELNPNFPNDSTEYVEVGFNLTGMDISERPMSKTVYPYKDLYYHIKLLYPKDTVRNYLGYGLEGGHVGLFTDLQYARIKLLRNCNYKIYATAIASSDRSVLNLDYYKYVRKLQDSTDVYNKFSRYFTPELFKDVTPVYSGGCNCPVFEDQKVYRFYTEKIINVSSNEKINLNLDRYFYQLNLKISSPSEGRVELSCEAPSFKYLVSCNDQDFSVSNIYSLAGEDLSQAAKFIKLKLEHFNSKNVSTEIATRDIQVKPNFETTINIDFNKFNADNTFKFSLDSTPMQMEEIEWK